MGRAVGRWLMAAVAAVGLISCGGGGKSASVTASSGSTSGVTAANNVLPVVVDGGPDNDSVNSLYTSVTLCVPGTTQCQTIDHIQVDTGSYGLRIFGSVLTLPLVQSTASDGGTLSECAQFVMSYSWGPLVTADVQLGGEKAASVPIHVLGAQNFVAPPADCSGTGTEQDTVADFGANGLLGVGVFEQDCGTECVNNAAAGFYYSCTSTACTPIALPLASQVTNPIALFAADNNGSILDLPAVADPGALTLSGSLIFGIDTQTNNVSGSESVLNVTAGAGDFTTTFNGQKLDTSFIDSGTDATFFNADITQCTGGDAGFYCPASAQTVSATLTGTNGVSATASVRVDNADTLASSYPNYTVLPGLTGTYTSDATTFDWGLPFYFGRRVATALELHTTAVGTGPYIGF
jgi:hypothetical protein